MKVVVIGCTHAGIAAVTQILKNYPQADITVFERQAQISYLSCATYLHIKGTVETLSDALYAEPTDFVKQGVHMQMQHDVIRVDAKDHTILVQNLTTKAMTTVSYDKLIMATGSVTAIPAITGIENPKVMLCKTYDQAHDLCQNTANVKRILIVGGGYVGVELAEGYADSGHQVLLIQQPSHLLNAYVEPELSEAIAKVIRDHGVQVVTNTTVTAFKETDTGSLLVKTDDQDYEVDMAAISAGIIPQTDLLQGKVRMTRNGAIETDDYMQTSDPDILAAGDCALVHFNPTGTMVYAPLASHAVRQGALAGLNVFKRRVRSIGTQVSTGMYIFKHTVACTGLTYAAAKAAKFAAAKVSYTAPYRPDFMPDAYPVTVELIYDRNNRKILGAQLMSKHDVSQSANVISSQIQNDSTIDQLAFLDMLFSPNFNNPFDYLNIVAQKAVAQEDGYLRT
ncbi:FAD-dependent oxidoreductase [Lactiplantibacillus sp. WILCCON 0030]|uniref:FAD-dependent oxidoreductase n=1 Tax=Lactiplantibacillus brownii TaxID=3069269 RepID=A0ABU1ABE2_9LACO|nr:FAD-dependent oxidoreductase [Lactiplantibacillus brownii]MDQ7938218.1 FAD-dependent oxidoreductase [Lactiplantibacillus brownii]